MDQNLRPFFSDFGISKFSKNTIKNIDILGYSPKFSPYEQRNFLAISPKSDVWAIAILLYELFSD